MSSAMSDPDEIKNAANRAVVVAMALHEPILYAVLSMWQDGKCTYEEALTMAIKALVEQIQALRTRVGENAVRELFRF